MEGTLKRISNRGFTLVELMVTLAMTALLVTAMYALFGDQEKVYATEEQIIQMQQNARVAMEMISRDVRMAGFFGCGFSSSTNFTDTVRNTNGDILFNMAPITGLDNLGGQNSYGAESGTDLLVLSYADQNTSSQVDAPPMNNSAASIHLSTAGILNIGDIAVVTDCTYTSVFQITNLQYSGQSVVHDTNQGGGNPDPANSTKDLGHVYEPGSRMYKLAQKYYWVDSNLQLHVANGGYNATLSKWQPDNQEAAIADNIENLQLEYGVDTDGNGTPDQWHNATDVTSGNFWNKVVAVRIYILARTARQEKDYINRHSYSVPDSSDPQTLGPYNDGYHRYFLVRSVALRNRWSG